jgi:hypothetical protein
LNAIPTWATTASSAADKRQRHNAVSAVMYEFASSDITDGVGSLHK